MSCDLNIFNENYNEKNICEQFSQFTANDSKIVGYIGTLSSRRVNYRIIEKLIEICPNLNFIFIGKRDGLESTNKGMLKIFQRDNVLILENIDYIEIPKIILI